MNFCLILSEIRWWDIFQYELKLKISPAQVNKGWPRLVSLWPNGAMWCHWSWSILVWGNVSSPLQHQVISWTNVDVLPVWVLIINYKKIWIKSQIHPLTELHLQIWSVKWWPFSWGPQWDNWFRISLIANALELLQSCTMPSIFCYWKYTKISIAMIHVLLACLRCIGILLGIVSFNQLSVLQFQLAITFSSI